MPYKVELGKINDVHARTIRPDGTIVDVDGRDIHDRLLARTIHGIHRAKVFSMPAVEAGSWTSSRKTPVGGSNPPDGFGVYTSSLRTPVQTATRPSTSGRR